MRRISWLLLPTSFILVVITASFLHPDPAGFGTHQTLGLPRCFFHALTGWRCPSCGLTTSFTYLLHFNIVQSFKSHPLGPLIFVVYALAATFSFMEFVGRPTYLQSFLKGRHVKWVYGGTMLYLATWVTRLVWDTKILRGIG